MSYHDIAHLISAEGRAYLSSVKDLPPDEAQQHAMEAARNGLIRFSDAIAIKGAADRVDKLAQSEAPPPGNVINDLKAQIRAALSGQQAPMQQMPQQDMPQQDMPQQGMPQQGMPPQGAPPQPGLAGLPVSNIGTQAMAGGGIVAFSGEEGSLVSAGPYAARLTEEEEARLNDLERWYEPPTRRSTDEYRGLAKRRQDILDYLDAQNKEAQPIGEAALASRISSATGQEPVAGSAAGDSIPASPTTAPVIPPNNGLGGLGDYLSFSSPAYEKMIRDAAPGPEINEAEIRAQSDRELAAAGIGNAANAYAKKVAGYTSEDIKNINREGKQAQAAAYFDAAASGDTTFLGSISRGLGGAARAKSGTSKELRTAQREAEKAQYDLDAAREALSLQKTDRGTAAVDKKEARRDKKAGVYQTLRSGQEQMNMSMQIARAKAAGKGSNQKLLVENVYAKRIEGLEALLDVEADPIKRAGIEAALGDLRGRLEQGSAAADASGAKRNQAINDQVLEAQMKAQLDPDGPININAGVITRLREKAKTEPLDDDEKAAGRKAQEIINTEMLRIDQTVRATLRGDTGGGDEFQLTPEQAALLAKHSGN